MLTLSPRRLGDLGLEQFSVSELFSSILVPGFFLLACILQLHYFHRPFMQLTDLERGPGPGARLPRRAHRCAALLPAKAWGLQCVPPAPAASTEEVLTQRERPLMGFGWERQKQVKALAFSHPRQPGRTFQRHQQQGPQLG